MAMPFSDGIELIATAIEKRDDDFLTFRWLLHYESQMSLDDFKNTLRHQNAQDCRPVAVIEDDAAAIIENLNAEKW